MMPEQSPSGFTAMHAYKLGDEVVADWPRSTWEIWWDRIRMLRWEAPRTEQRMFVVTEVTHGENCTSTLFDPKPPASPSP